MTKAATQVSGRMQTAGAPIPVQIVSSPAIVDGGAAIAVVDVTNQAGYTQPVGAPVPIAIVSGRLVEGGNAQPVWVVSGGSLYAGKVLAVAPANLLAYWPLAESSGAVATDESGNARNGSYSNTTLGVTGIGDGRTAAQFNGTTSFANIYSTSLNAAWIGGSFTIAMWLKVAAASVWTDGTTRRPLYISVDNNNRIFVERSTVNNRLDVVYIAGSTNDTKSLTGLSLTGWFHLAVTINKVADTGLVYLNGVQQGAALSTLGTWAGALSATRTTVGASSTVPAEVWNGQIADVGLWNVPLAAAQIASLASVAG